MNTAQLKSYAPQARLDFITEVKAQAARFGINADSIEPAKVEGDVLLVGGQARHPALAGTSGSVCLPHVLPIARID